LFQVVPNIQIHKIKVNALESGKIMSLQKMAKKRIVDFSHEFEQNRLRSDARFTHIAVGIEILSVAFPSLTY
jgi:hypothetical protein